MFRGQFGDGQIIRRFQNPGFGNDRRYQFRRSYVERRIESLDSIWRGADSAILEDFIVMAFLDRDAGTIR